MEDKLDFSLPEKRRKGSAAGKISVLLLLIVLALTAANLFIKQGGPSPEGSGGALSPEQTKELAAKLAQRNLYGRAAEVWQDYLKSENLSDTERAKALFQTGTLLEKAGSYAEAIEYYYRSEATAALAELSSQISTHLKECFERLGKFSALRYELMDRTSVAGKSQAGGKIVAEIGPEKITEADLDAIIEGSIDNQLSQWKAFMSDEQVNQQKQKMLEQFKSPQAKQQSLQSWLAQEVLYRQALEEQLSEKEDVKKVLAEQARGVLSQHLMNQQLAAKINLTESDLQTYYSANKGEYIEPAGAKISHILVEQEQQAKDLIARIKGGEDFAKLAKEVSKDEATKETGGGISTDVVKGAHVTGIGQAAELNDNIFATAAGSVVAEPFQTEKGWEIVRVEQKQPERQKAFDEVREQVMSTLLGQKRQEVQQQYIEQMMNKYNVIIHSSALTGAGEGQTGDTK